MPRPLSPSAVRARELEVWTFLVDGFSQTDIAEKLGITQGAVSKIVARVSLRRAKELTPQIDARRELHEQRLLRMYREAMAAWERSKQPQKKSRSQETKVGGMGPEDLAQLEDGKPVDRDQVHGVMLRRVVSKEAATTCGEVAYLNTALAIDAELRKLWGVNAPKQIDLVDQRRPLEKLSDDELATRIRENVDELRGMGLL